MMGLKEFGNKTVMDLLVGRPTVARQPAINEDAAIVEAPQGPSAVLGGVGLLEGSVDITQNKMRQFF